MAGRGHNPNSSGDAALYSGDGKQQATTLLYLPTRAREVSRRNTVHSRRAVGMTDILPRETNPPAEDGTRDGQCP